MRNSLKVSLALLIAMSASAPVASAQAIPTDAENAKARNNPCTDPWVSLATSMETAELTVGKGGNDQCKVKLYNSGSWFSFAELLGHVRATMASLKSQGGQYHFSSNSLPYIPQNSQLAGVPEGDMVKLFNCVVVMAKGGMMVNAGGSNEVDKKVGFVIAEGGVGRVVPTNAGAFSRLLKKSAPFVLT